MTGRITISRVAEAHRAVLDDMAKTYFAEVLPEGPPYFPMALDRYWIEPGRHPYLIEEDGVPIGFALVWNHRDGTHELAEFTIQPAFRHRGVGTEAAELVFNSLGGDWVLGVSAQAPGGMPFWRQCLSACENVCDITEAPPRTATQAGIFNFRVERA
jgi:predicted acetyltransferase